ncbi:hypothetical protein IFM89_002398 [Coptis chinensis]|uniref:Protein FAR1-RELATED SEQUENCE n=1 Tax=Coptis chinensis TaxID=261450 RepID=A0A835IN98_9MAGN|nr:hypothetical protein IFM89_002398 [Coptis chinensis]
MHGCIKLNLKKVKVASDSLRSVQILNENKNPLRYRRVPICLHQEQYPLMEDLNDKYVEVNAQNGTNRVEKALQPFVGMEFNFYEDAYEFFNQYAKKVGFGIRLSKIYTEKIFKKFQNEIEEMDSCFNTTQVRVDGQIVTYIVKVRMVSEKGERWLKEYKTPMMLKVIIRCNGMHDNIYKYAIKFFEEAVVSKEHYKVALEALAEAMNKVKQVESCELSNTPTSTPPGATDNGVKVQDPVRSKRIGRPKEKRLPNLSEKIRKPKRQKGHLTSSQRIDIGHLGSEKRWPASILLSKAVRWC